MNSQTIQNNQNPDITPGISQIHHFQNETGEGTITIYPVFPGVMLAYNDFHMSMVLTENCAKIVRKEWLTFDSETKVWGGYTN